MIVALTLLREVVQIKPLADEEITIVERLSEWIREANFETTFGRDLELILKNSDNKTSTPASEAVGTSPAIERSFPELLSEVEPFVGSNGYVAAEAVRTVPSIREIEQRLLHGRLSVADELRATEFLSRINLYPSAKLAGGQWAEMRPELQTILYKGLLDRQELALADQVFEAVITKAPTMAHTILDLLLVDEERTELPTFGRTMRALMSSGLSSLSNPELLMVAEKCQTSDDIIPALVLSVAERHIQSPGENLLGLLWERLNPETRRQSVHKLLLSMPETTPSGVVEATLKLVIESDPGKVPPKVLNRIRQIWSEVTAVFPAPNRSQRKAVSPSASRPAQQKGPAPTQEGIGDAPELLRSLHPYLEKWYKECFESVMQQERRLGVEHAEQHYRAELDRAKQETQRLDEENKHLHHQNQGLSAAYTQQLDETTRLGKELRGDLATRLRDHCDMLEETLSLSEAELKDPDILEHLMQVCRDVLAVLAEEGLWSKQGGNSAG